MCGLFVLKSIAQARGKVNMFYKKSSAAGSRKKERRTARTFPPGRHPRKKKPPVCKTGFLHILRQNEKNIFEKTQKTLRKGVDKGGKVMYNNRADFERGTFFFGAADDL